MKSKQLIVIFLLSLSPFYMHTQDVAMADTFRAEGKIYVVVAVACIVLAIMSLYMINIDRKISRLEKNEKK